VAGDLYDGVGTAEVASVYLKQVHLVEQGGAAEVQTLGGLG